MDSALPFLDIHTHTPLHEGEQSIPSFGLHPWHLRSNWTDDLLLLQKEIALFRENKTAESRKTAARRKTCSFLQTREPEVNPASSPLAPTESAESRPPHPMFLIGECGLDRVCSTPYTLQQPAFEAQIAMSEELGVPLVLHCVRALDDVLRLKRGTRQPWIFHGFRGKPQQLQQLLAHDFYVSFGIRHNAETLRACPPERLFLETDDSPEPIAPLYELAAALHSTTAHALCRQLWSNLEAAMRP